MQRKQIVTHKIEVQVKLANQKNGPGHVSMSLHKEEKGQRDTQHISFFPSTLGSVINALSLGSIPVTGRNDHNPLDDTTNADVIFYREVSADEYAKAVSVSQQLLEQKPNYSVFGKYNPISTAITKFSAFYMSSEKSKSIHMQKRGFHAAEDDFGMPIYKDHEHIVMKRKSHNCVSAVSETLKPIGVDLEGCITPNSVAQRLHQQGFSRSPS